MMAGRVPPKAVYIHIPFCVHKCFYCDFNTYALKGQPVMDYLHALEREMEQTVRQFPFDTIETIFVGGGTPTVLLPDEMAYFLQIVRAYFPLRDESCEFTMEANPGTTAPDKLAVMKAGGVNRISFGAQTFNPQLLKDIGRIHTVEDVYRSIKDAQAIGFDNISIDLMFGLPKQTVEDVRDSLDQALQLDLQHYSIYSLKVEENTLFHALQKRNQLILPNEDDELEMYLLIMKRLAEAGYVQYEISSFAKPGFEGKHNVTYWRNESYYGLGAGAHGYMFGNRHVNCKGVKGYIAATERGLPRIEQFPVTRKEAMEDFMMVGLRMLNGVESEHFTEQFDCSMEDVFGNSLQKMMKLKLLETTAEGYRLTAQGLLFGNEVFAEFIS